ncbi:MAG: folate-binding protein [Rhodospirillales bacterium]
MTEQKSLLFEDRGLLAVTGDGAEDFLQGLISNDIGKVGPDRAIHAAFLTPQGRYLHDFFIVRMEDDFLLDCEAARRGDLKRRLGMYKLHSNVGLADKSDEFAAAAVFGEGATESLGLSGEAGHAVPFGGGILYVDPRLAAAGGRAVLPRQDAGEVLAKAGFEAALRVDYDSLRLPLGLPDGSRDLEVEQAILLENGFDELGGLDWNKGCYLGQELTARTKYRGLIKKRLMPVVIDGPTPPPGTPVMAGGKEAGKMRSAIDGIGLASIHLEEMEKATATGTPFTAGEARLTPKKPDWAVF